MEIDELAWRASLVQGIGVILSPALRLLAAPFLLAESTYDRKGRGFLQISEGHWDDSVFRAVVVIVIRTNLPRLKLAKPTAVISIVAAQEKARYLRT